MEFKHYMNRILAIVMCLIMVFTTCAVAEPVPAVDEHQHTEEVSAENVEAVVEELGEVDLMMDLPAEEELQIDMPDVFDKFEIIDTNADLDIDINDGCNRHVFRDGKCINCDYECEHLEEDRDEYSREVRFERVDDDTHTKYYVNVEYCWYCGMDMKVGETEYSETESHYSWYYPDNCPCGQVLSNPNEGEENTCTHPNARTELIKEPDWDSEDFLVKYDDKGHTYKWRELKHTYCEDCDSDFYEPTGVTGEETEAHSWAMEGSSICNICPAKCKHPNVVEQNSWDGGWEAEYVDENTHKTVWTLRANVRCLDCNKTYGVDTDETIEVVAPHKFVDPDWPHCEDCWYEPEGDVTIEDDDSKPECTHANVVSQIIYEDKWDYEKKDEKGHIAKYTAYKTDVCADCGMEIDEDKRERVEAEDKTEYEPHTWWVNGDADWWKYGECEYCGYINQRAHKNALKFEEHVGFNYSNITGETHDSVGVIMDRFICPDCGLSDSSANGQTVVETAEPHNYINGVCPCGVVCAHEKLATSVEKEATFDATSHTVVITTTEYCETCNVINSQNVETVTGEHELENDVCKICGFGELSITESVLLGVGEKFTLEVDATENAKVTFASDNTKVATVNKTSGAVTAKKAGTAIITATDTTTGVTATCTVTVKKAPTSVKASKSKITLGVGETFDIDAKLSSGSASNKITFSSSKKSVATVNSDGLITAVKAGTAKITVKAFNGKKGTATVTVKAAPQVVTVTADKAVMSVGQTAKLTTKLTTSAKKAAAGAYAYSVSPADAATITDGVLTAVKTGTVTVTAKTYNGVTGTATIEIKAAPDKAEVEKTEIALGVKETLTLKPTIANGSPATFTYTTSSSKIATVSTSGKITAKKAGTADITVKPHEGEAVTVKVTVTAAPKSVKLSAKSKTLGVGESFQLNATLTKNTTSKLTWKSSKSSVVSVDENGVLTAKKAGKATITVSTFNKKKATCTVTVKAAPTSITLKADKEVLSIGQKAKLTAAFNKNAGGAYAYTVEPAGIVEIEGGYAIPKAVGTATVTATTFNGLTASVTLEVKPAPDAIVLDKTSVTLGVKETLTLKPEIANGSPADLKFKSSKKSVATVSSSGKITAKKAGTAKITITPNGDAEKAVTVTVKVSKAATKVSLSSKKLSMTTGETASLTAKISGASNKLTWKSSNEKVVAVDANGVLTAVGEGKATITVTTFNKKKATCAVTVTAPVETPEVPEVTE